MVQGVDLETLHLVDFGNALRVEVSWPGSEVEWRISYHFASIRRTLFPCDGKPSNLSCRTTILTFLMQGLP